MYTILVEGFETQEQAKAFINWYNGQGEQDASVWFEARKTDGEIDVTFMPVDCEKTYPIEFENNQTKMSLIMVM